MIEKIKRHIGVGGMVKMPYGYFRMEYVELQDGSVDVAFTKVSWWEYLKFRIYRAGWFA